MATVSFQAEDAGGITPGPVDPGGVPADRFQWHRLARLHTDGIVLSEPGLAGDAVIADVPPGAALQSALAVAASGGAFRIGGDTVPTGAPAVSSAAEDVSMFETLSGGTGGAPKRILRTQASWIASFAVNRRLFGIGPGARVAVLGRLVHSLALYGGLEALHLGAALHLLDRMRPDRQRRALARAGVGVLYATPAQLRLLLEAGGAPLPDLRFVLIGGSKLDPALRGAVQAMCPAADIREFYGAAETSFITLTDAMTPEGSVGAAYPGVSIEVRDADGTPTSEIGEIWVQSPYLAARCGSDDPRGAVWRDGWLSVRELGRISDGWLYLCGRQSRMVTVADQNVFPEEIETFLLSLPGIARAAVIALPDPLRGHVLEAVLIGDLGVGGQDNAILTRLRQRFGALMAPRRLHWRNDWPMLASGKTDLATLAADLAATLPAGAIAGPAAKSAAASP